MLTLALRMGSIACLTLAVTGYLIVSQLLAMIAPLPLIGVSLVVGLWTWWEAGRLIARNAYLSETLLTFGALMALLVVWVRVAGVALLPRETWVHNGSYNGALTSGVAFAGAFVLVPVGGFLLVASIELLRKVTVLHGWLPMATRPRWQRTLAVPFWRRLKLGVVTYLAVGLAMVAILTLTSPYQHPRVREFDLPDSSVFPESLAVGPDGNVWFALWGKSSYQVGSISSSGQLTPQRFAVPEPPKCVYNCTTGADLQLGPDHNFWYITTQTFAPHKTELRRTTPDGVTSVFTLPSGGVNTSFAFDGAGTVWCTANSARTLTDLSGLISRIDASGQVTTYPMSSGIVPVAILVTSDGTVWFFDAGTYALGTISATGKVTEYPVPSLPSDVLLASEQLVETADHTLWFADPHGGIIGHITAAHMISLAPLPAGSVPRHLVADAAGGLWFIDTRRAAVGHLSASGQLTSYPINSPLGPQSSLTVGPDSSVWFTLENRLGQIPPSGRMKLYDIPTLNAGLGSIIVGPDGHVWFAEEAGLIGELTP
jgi:virginiamycin B lyase